MSRSLLLPVFFFLMILGTPNASVAQDDTPSDTSSYDTTFHFGENNEEVLPVDDQSDDEDDESWLRVATNDTLPVNTRQVDEEVLEEMQSDPDMNYELPPTVAESLWDRFWAWVADFLSSIFISTVEAGWGRLSLYLLGIVGLVVIVMLLLKVDAMRMLYSGQKSKVAHMVFNEDIENMNFDKLIEEAIAAREYRRGIRLLFLYALRMLSDRNHVVLDAGKTNHDYLNEVKGKDVHHGFNELNFYFEYAWYGNFAITADTFEKAHATFLHWKNRVK